jgi:hypothetical protein
LNSVFGAPGTNNAEVREQVGKPKAGTTVTPIHAGRLSFIVEAGDYTARSETFCRSDKHRLPFVAPIITKALLTAIALAGGPRSARDEFG